MIAFKKLATNTKLENIQEYDRVWIAETGNDTWGMYRIVDTGNTLITSNSNIITLDGTSNIQVGSLVVSNHPTYN